MICLRFLGGVFGIVKLMLKVNLEKFISWRKVHVFILQLLYWYSLFFL